MAKTYGEKLKPLLIRDYLLQYTDEEHPATLRDIQKMLAEHEISAERKSIYRDLRILGCSADGEELGELEIENCGMDIVHHHGQYFVRERDFTLQEVKLLVDMVQSSNSITHRKTQELIEKLETLTSVHEAKKLRRTVFVRNRVKSMNESVYLNVDKLSEAINRDRAVSFQYFRYDIEKKKQLRHGGERYRVSPFALVWVDQNYYLLGYNEKVGAIRTYRVDRMTRVEITASSRQGKREYDELDVAALPTKVFHMYLGKFERVTMRFDRALIDTVLDRFGMDSILVPDGEEHFTINTEIAVSPQFYGWVAGFGTGAEVLAPPHIRQGMAEHLRAAAKLYENADRRSGWEEK